LRIELELILAAEYFALLEDEERLLPDDRLRRIVELDVFAILHRTHQRIVGDERLALPVLVLGLEEELDDQARKKLSLGEMRRALQVRAVRLAANHDLVRQHLAIRRDERGRRILLDERDRQAASLEQAEDVRRGGVGVTRLLRDDVMLGAVASGDVIL